MTKDTGTYTLTIVWRREHGEDDVILAERGEEVTARGLVRQFAKEMEELMNDHGGPAGFFQVMEYEEGNAAFHNAEVVGKARFGLKEEYKEGVAKDAGEWW